VAEILIYVSPCDGCEGKGVAPNPDWARFVSGLSAQQLAAGIKSDIPQVIPCAKCKGLGEIVSDGFWRLRELMRRADALGKTITTPADRPWNKGSQ
jgi:hypothetical protein